MATVSVFNCIWPGLIRAKIVNDSNIKAVKRILVTVIAIDILAALSMILIGSLGAASLISLSSVVSYLFIVGGIGIGTSCLASLKFGPIKCLSERISQKVKLDKAELYSRF